MQLVRIKRTGYERSVIRVEKYYGVCDGCGVELEMLQPFLAIQIYENDTMMLFYPAVLFGCPSCGKEISVIRFYKNLNVTKELQTITHAH